VTKPLRWMGIRLMPWKWDGVVVIGGTSAQFATYAKKKYNVDIESGAHAAGHAYVAYGELWLIWVETLTNLPELAHEALHVVSGVLEARGFKHTHESEEAYTYTMEDLLRQVLACKKWTRI
jgi:hypothetical protein